MPLPRCYFAHKIYRFLIPDAVVWLLLIPDGINGVFSNACNVAKCTLYYKLIEAKYCHTGHIARNSELVVLTRLLSKKMTVIMFVQKKKWLS